MVNFEKKSNFSKLTGKIYEIIEYSTFSSITNFQTVIFHTVSSTKSIPRNSQFLATRSDLWGRINCELRGVPVSTKAYSKGPNNRVDPNNRVKWKNREI